MENIPVIDLQAFRDGGLQAIHQEALVEACEDHGFFLLTNHGCDAQIAAVFEQPLISLPCREIRKRRFIAMRKTRWVITTAS